MLHQLCDKLRYRELICRVPADIDFAYDWITIWLIDYFQMCISREVSHDAMAVSNMEHSL